jgi:tetratricopeptide (TPR) repeat protein
MQTADGSWQVVHPGCAQVRQEDLVEVEQMIDAGEVEIAQDELRWLLAECRDFISAHKLLGDLAASENDFRLARGHYGYAYQIVIKAIDASGQVKALPYRHEANQTFFQAGRGLASCLNKLGKPRVARDVINRLLQLDPSDPLRLGGLQKSQDGKRGKKRR